MKKTLATISLAVALSIINVESKALVRNPAPIKLVINQPSCENPIRILERTMQTLTPDPMLLMGYKNFQ